MQINNKRTCVVTRKKYDKSDLIRVSYYLGNISISSNLGRGVYILKDLEVLKLAKKKKVLDHALRASVSSNIYDELIRIVDENK